MRFPSATRLLLVLDDADTARRHLAVIERFVVERLRLRLNPRRVLVSPIHASCDVLGYVRCGDGRLRLRRRGVRKFWRRLPVLQARLDAGEIDGSRVRASVASWLGYAKHADAFRLSRTILARRDVRNVGKRLLVQAVDRSRVVAKSKCGRPPIRALRTGRLLVIPSRKDAAIASRHPFADVAHRRIAMVTASRDRKKPPA